MRGQYGAGKIGEKDYAAYRKEPDVAADSQIETYVALKLQIDNWRWGGMPFYLRTGKALAKRARRGRGAVQARALRAVPRHGGRAHDRQPADHPRPADEGLSLEFGAKVPGPKVNLGRVSMTSNTRIISRAAPSTGYETLIYDCMIGDQTLFQRADAVEAGWKVVQPLLDDWAKEPKHNFEIYKAGSEGPDLSDKLLEKDGRSWHPVGG